MLADVMTTRLVSVTADEPTAAAVARMARADVGSAIVLDGRSNLIGIFTERDVLGLVGRGVDLATTSIGEVMTRDVVTLHPDDDVPGAARLMAERRIRHVPIVEDGRVLGMVCVRDVLAVLLELAYSRHDEAAHDTARELLHPG